MSPPPGREINGARNPANLMTTSARKGRRERSPHPHPPGNPGGRYGVLIIRRSKPTENFTILPNGLLRDDRLSYCARGVLGELLSRPTGWETNADALSERARRHRDGRGEGRRAMRAAFAELEAAGYMLRRRERGEGGKFVTVLEVYDVPQDRGTACGTSADGTSVNGTSVSGTSSRSTDHGRTEEEHESTPASGREPAPDGRRPSTGSTAREPSGSAASTNSKPAPITTRQRQAVQDVLGRLPAGLTALLPAKTPPALARAILNALAQDDPAADRTPDQLVRHRLMPKWDKHYAGLADTGQLERPVGALIAMLTRDAECGNPRCDERINVDTGSPCPFCQARAELHAALRRAPDQPTAEEGAPEPQSSQPAHEPQAGEPPPPAVIPTQRTTEPHPVAAAIRQQIRAARPHVHHQHNRTRKTA